MPKKASVLLSLLIPPKREISSGSAGERKSELSTLKGDVSKTANSYLQTVNELGTNLTALKNKGENIEELASLIDLRKRQTRPRPRRNRAPSLIRRRRKSRQRHRRQPKYHRHRRRRHGSPSSAPGSSWLVQNLLKLRGFLVRKKSPLFHPSTLAKRPALNCVDIQSLASSPKQTSKTRRNCPYFLSPKVTTPISKSRNFKNSKI